MVPWIYWGIHEDDCYVQLLSHSHHICVHKTINLYPLHKTSRVMVFTTRVYIIVNMGDGVFRDHVRRSSQPEVK